MGWFDRGSRHDKMKTDRQFGLCICGKLPTPHMEKPVHSPGKAARTPDFVRTRFHRLHTGFSHKLRFFGQFSTTTQARLMLLINIQILRICLWSQPGRIHLKETDFLSRPILTTEEKKLNQNR